MLGTCYDGMQNFQTLICLFFSSGRFQQIFPTYGIYSSIRLKLIVKMSRIVILCLKPSLLKLPITRTIYIGDYFVSTGSTITVSHGQGTFSGL